MVIFRTMVLLPLSMSFKVLLWYHQSHRYEQYWIVKKRRRNCCYRRKLPFWRYLRWNKIFCSNSTLLLTRYHKTKENPGTLLWRLLHQHIGRFQKQRIWTPSYENFVHFFVFKISWLNMCTHWCCCIFRDSTKHLKLNWCRFL